MVKLTSIQWLCSIFFKHLVNWLLHTCTYIINSFISPKNLSIYLQAKIKLNIFVLPLEFSPKDLHSQPEKKLDWIVMCLFFFFVSFLSNVLVGMYILPSDWINVQC